MGAYYMTLKVAHSPGRDAILRFTAYENECTLRSGAVRESIGAINHVSHAIENLFKLKPISCDHFYASMTRFFETP